jgi:hypothetical protein
MLSVADISGRFRNHGTGASLNLKIVCHYGVLRVQWCPVIESSRKQQFELGLSIFSQFPKTFRGLKFVS